MVPAACVHSLALVYEDAVVTVLVPLLCLSLQLPSSPSPLLWAAACATVAVGALRLGGLLVTAGAARLRPRRTMRGFAPAMGVRPRGHPSFSSDIHEAVGDAQPWTAHRSWGNSRVHSAANSGHNSGAQSPYLLNAEGYITPSYSGYLHGGCGSTNACASNPPGTPAEPRGTSTGRLPMPSLPALRQAVAAVAAARGRHTCSALGSALALLIAVAALPLAAEAHAALPSPTQLQPLLLLGGACLVAGAALAAARASTCARLDSIQSAHRVRDGIDWRELVDSIRETAATLDALARRGGLMAPLTSLHRYPRRARGAARARRGLRARLAARGTLGLGRALRHTLRAVHRARPLPSARARRRGRRRANGLRRAPLCAPARRRARPFSRHRIRPDRGVVRAHRVRDDDRTPAAAF
jgi:hypothetical protein